MGKTILYFQKSKSKADRLKRAGLVRFANSQGWNVSVLDYTRKCHESIRSILDFWKPDGVVANLEECRQDFGSVPVVVMSTPPKSFHGNVSFITNDSKAYAALAAKELIGLGYPNFAFAGAFDGEAWSPMREREFRRILSLHGKTCRTFIPRQTESVDAISFQKRLRQWLKTLAWPCALFASNDEVGRAVLIAARAVGIAVPDELAVCSVDNDEEVCLNTVPTLTSIEPDFDRGGILAGLLFKEIFDNPGLKPRQDFFGPVGIVRRGSTSLRHANVERDILVERALERIRREVQYGVTAADIAKMFPCSARMAQIRFRKITGKTIQDAILGSRMELAQTLLKRPSIMLEAVATFSGWKTYSVFRRHFIRITGLSPSAWRNRNSSTPAPTP